MEPIRELAIEFADRERHSEFFAKESILSGYDPAKPIPAYTMANPELVNLKDTLERPQSNKMI